MGPCDHAGAAGVNKWVHARSKRAIPGSARYPLDARHNIGEW